jgi:hypothetical protein
LLAAAQACDMTRLRYLDDFGFAAEDSMATLQAKMAEHRA